jgi:hypothetical protein
MPALIEARGRRKWVSSDGQRRDGGGGSGFTYIIHFEARCIVEHILFEVEPARA